MFFRALLFSLITMTSTFDVKAQSLDQIKKFRLDTIPNKMIYQWAKLSGVGEEKKVVKSGTARKEIVKYLDRIASDPLNVVVLHADLTEGKIEYEKYAHGVTEHTPLFLYSVTKSFVALSTLSAICEAGIDIDDDIGKHSSRLRNTVYGEVSIRQVLKMQSGVMRNEYFKKNKQIPVFRSFLKKKETPLETIQQLKSSQLPEGKSFDYSGYDTNALLVLTEDITNNTFLERFQKDFLTNNRLIKPVYWMTSKNAEPAGMAALTASANNVVRLASRFYEILDGNKCVSRLFSQGKLRDRSDGKYGFQVWYTGWTSKDRKDIIHMRGNGGQIISINLPAKTVTFVYSLALKYEGLGEIGSALGKFERSLFP